MGKGKRNRQLHVEDKQTNPAKAKDRAKKQQFIMPKWAKMTICFVLLAAILIGAVAISLLNGGIVYRTRILVESNSAKYRPQMMKVQSAPCQKPVRNHTVRVLRNHFPLDTRLPPRGM